jgi:hypothetical protein
MSEIHVKETFRNLGIEWRGGDELRRGYTIEVRSSDRNRAIASLLEDDRIGNISFLDGVESPDFEPALETIRQSAVELMKTSQFCGITLKGRLLRHPEVGAALKDYPQVVSFAARHRTYLDEDNRRHAGMEGWVELAVNLEKEVAGKRMYFYLHRDGEGVRLRGGNAWWHGGEQSKEELWRRWRARPK